MVLVISHRGDLGEFNPAQVPVGQATELLARTDEMLPLAQSLGDTGETAALGDPSSTPGSKCV